MVVVFHLHLATGFPATGPSVSVPCISFPMIGATQLRGLNFWSLLTTDYPTRGRSKLDESWNSFATLFWSALTILKAAYILVRTVSLRSRYLGFFFNSQLFCPNARLIEQRNFIFHSCSECGDAKQILEPQVLYNRNRRELELNPEADSALR